MTHFIHEQIVDYATRIADDSPNNDIKGIRRGRTVARRFPAVVATVANHFPARGANLGGRSTSAADRTHHPSDVPLGSVEVRRRGGDSRVYRLKSNHCSHSEVRLGGHRYNPDSMTVTHAENKTAPLSLKNIIRKVNVTDCGTVEHTARTDCGKFAH
jgi:hypothetical protein